MGAGSGGIVGGGFTLGGALQVGSSGGGLGGPSEGHQCRAPTVNRSLVLLGPRRGHDSVQRPLAGRG